MNRIFVFILLTPYSCKLRRRSRLQDLANKELVVGLLYIPPEVKWTPWIRELLAHGRKFGGSSSAVGESKSEEYRVKEPV